MTRAKTRHLQGGVSNLVQRLLHEESSKSGVELAAKTTLLAAQRDAEGLPGLANESSTRPGAGAKPWEIQKVFARSGEIILPNARPATGRLPCEFQKLSPWSGDLSLSERPTDRFVLFLYFLDFVGHFSWE